MMFIALVWNLFVTAVLAVGLVAASRFAFLSRRPALRHTLWLLVLAKLVTPLLIPVPLLPPAVLNAEPSHGFVASSEETSSTTDHMIEASIPVHDLPSIDVVQSEAALEPRPASHWPETVLHGLVGFSLIGTCLLITTHAMRAATTGRWLRRTGTSDAKLAQTCQQVATELGISTRVRSFVIDARTVPLLWGWRRPVVVVPRQLVDDLGDEALRCIATHELAHFARRDHWANLFALLTRAVFWWNPVTWWAHREIRAAQESCCDAIAIDHANTTRQNYAATLLKALDFVQPKSAVQCKVALQMGSRSSILRRFEMIGNTRLTYHVSRWTILTLFLVMFPLLCLPVRSQEKEQPAVVVTDRSLSERGSSPNESDLREASGEEVKAGKDPKQLFLTGISEKANTASAWVLDRATKSQHTLDKGTAFRVGDTSVTIESMDRDAVLVSVQERLYRWKLGVPFSEVLAGRPEQLQEDVQYIAPGPEFKLRTKAGAATKTDQKDDAVKGELAGGGLSGPVQIELLTGTDVMVLRGKKEDVSRLAELLGKIKSSRPESEQTDEKRPDKKQLLEAYRVAPLDPDTVLRVLQTLVGGRPDLRMALDPKSGNLIVLATREEHEEIKGFLRKMVTNDADVRKLEEKGYRAPRNRPQGDTKLKLQFRMQPWEDVLKWYAETAGLSLVTDEMIPGTFNYADDREYTVAEVLHLLNSVLVTKEYVLVIRDRMLFVVDIADGIPAELVPRVSVSELPNRDELELVSVLLPLGKRDPEEARTSLSRILSPFGQMTVMPEARQILVTDRVAKIRLITQVELLRKALDQAGSRPEDGRR